MTEVVVTRSGQITLLKEIRDRLGIHEGDTVNLNITGGLVILSKRDPTTFLKGDFLAANFRRTKGVPISNRFKRLGVT